MMYGVESIDVPTICLGWNQSFNTDPCKQTRVFLDSRSKSEQAWQGSVSRQKSFC